MSRDANDIAGVGVGVARAGGRRAFDVVERRRGVSVRARGVRDAASKHGAGAGTLARRAWFVESAVIYCRVTGRGHDAMGRGYGAAWHGHGATGRGHAVTWRGHK
jgi:hypothetical protein